MSRGKNNALQSLMKNRKRPTTGPKPTRTNKSAKSLFEIKFGNKELNSYAREYANTISSFHKPFGPKVCLDFEHEGESEYLLDANADYQITSVHLKRSANQRNQAQAVFAMSLAQGMNLFPSIAKLGDEEGMKLIRPLLEKLATSNTVLGLYLRLDELEQEIIEHQGNNSALTSRLREQKSITNRLEPNHIFASAYLNWLIYEPQSSLRSTLMQYLFDQENTGAKGDSIIGALYRNGDNQVITVSDERLAGFNRYHPNPIVIFQKEEWLKIRPEFLKTIEQWLY